MGENCGSCRFYKDRGAMTGYGECRRFPKPVSTNDGRWCGEYQSDEKEPE